MPCHPGPHSCLHANVTTPPLHSCLHANNITAICFLLIMTCDWCFVSACRKSIQREYFYMEDRQDDEIYSDRPIRVVRSLRVDVHCLCMLSCACSMHLPMHMYVVVCRHTYAIISHVHHIQALLKALCHMQALLKALFVMKRLHHSCANSGNLTRKKMKDEEEP